MSKGREDTLRVLNQIDYSKLRGNEMLSSVKELLVYEAGNIILVDSKMLQIFRDFAWFIQPRTKK